MCDRDAPHHLRADVPGEAGAYRRAVPGQPEIEAINWSGFVVNSATPANAVARLNAETVKALNMPEVRELLRAQAVIATPGTPEEFAALIKSDGERYRRIIREANVRVE